MVMIPKKTIKIEHTPTKHSFFSTKPRFVSEEKNEKEAEKKKKNGTKPLLLRHKKTPRTTAVGASKSEGEATPNPSGASETKVDQLGGQRPWGVCSGRQSPEEEDGGKVSMFFIFLY